MTNGPDFGLSLGIECGCPRSPSAPRAADWRQHSAECRKRQRLVGDAEGHTATARDALLAIAIRYAAPVPHAICDGSSIEELSDATETYRNALIDEAFAWDALVPKGSVR